MRASVEGMMGTLTKANPLTAAALADDPPQNGGDSAKESDKDASKVVCLSIAIHVCIYIYICIHIHARV